jgi:hypothetical protein
MIEYHAYQVGADGYIVSRYHLFCSAKTTTKRWPRPSRWLIATALNFGAAPRGSGLAASQRVRLPGR